MQKLTTFALTDVGRKRDHNEDAYAIGEEHHLYVVCDGMGGHASGEVASRLTTEHMLGFFAEHGDTPVEDLPYKVAPGSTRAEALLSNSVQYANERVFIEGMKDSKLEGMGTTMVAVRAEPDVLVMAHVGDSRVYRWRTDGELEQITADHSLLNHKIAQGELTTPEQIAGFKQGNIIVRAIGLKDYVEPEVQSVPRRPGDLFLLCSDGLSDMVDDWSIQNVLEVNDDDLEEASACLVRMANDRGGKDNITVMLIRVDDDPVVVKEEEVTDPGAIKAFHVEDTRPSGIRAVEETLQSYPSAADAAAQIAEDDEPGFDGFHDEVTDPGVNDGDADYDPDGHTDISQPAFVGYDENDAPVPAPAKAAGPSRRPVQVKSGTTSVAKTGGGANKPKPVDHDVPTKRTARKRQPLVIVEEPSIIVDDSLLD